MKRKRKPKMEMSHLWKHIVIEMTWHGFSRGMALGTLYGILMLVTAEQRTQYVSIPVFLLFPICFGLPLGASMGIVAGVFLGFLNGFLIVLLTRLFFVPVIDQSLYRSSLSTISMISTLAGGILFFDSVSLRFRLSRFQLVIVPALIAAIVSGYASQRAARRYLAAMAVAEAV